MLKNIRRADKMTELPFLYILTDPIVVIWLMTSDSQHVYKFSNKNKLVNFVSNS